MSHAATFLAVLSSAFPAAAPRAVTTPAPPPIKHVFVIVLENENYESSFGKDSKAPYLAQTLPTQGMLLTHYYGIGHVSLDNYVAMVSGQSPNPLTQSDCQIYSDFAPDVIGADGQAMGTGCVYPADVKTVADQLTAKGLTWGGYMEDMGNTPTDAQTCRHPNIGTQDTTQSARATDQYAARHNPFVYFHSIIDSPDCAKYDVPLTRLGPALGSDQVPSFVFITPNLCHDGHDTPCKNGEPGGMTSANQFLEKWVPQILGSRAYQRGGLLMVTFDEAGPDASACCVQDHPNTPNAGGTQQGPGGGKVGAVLISQFIKPGSVNDTPYNHYSLLRSVEDVFGLGQVGLADKAKGFGPDVYNQPGACFDHPLPRSNAKRVKAGTIIASVTRKGRRLTIRLRHSATVTVTATGLRLKRTRAACGTLAATLPRRARSVTISASASGKLERRTLKLR